MNNENKNKKSMLINFSSSRRRVQDVESKRGIELRDRGILYILVNN